MFSGTKVRIISTLVERWASWMAAAQLPVDVARNFKMAENFEEIVLEGKPGVCR